MTQKEEYELLMVTLIVNAKDWAKRELKMERPEDAVLIQYLNCVPITHIVREISNTLTEQGFYIKRLNLNELIIRTNGGNKTNVERTKCIPTRRVQFRRVKTGVVKK